LNTKFIIQILLWNKIVFYELFIFINLNFLNSFLYDFYSPLFHCAESFENNILKHLRIEIKQR